ncbi:MAG TPA: NADH-quinone oxidoreductase subunit C [Kineosporiaceae bacterium]
MTGVPARLRRAVTSRDRIVEAVADLLDRGYRCLLVGAENAGGRGVDGVQVGYLFARPAPVEDRVELVVDVPADDMWIPSVAAISYPAGRFERGVHDLFGVRPRDHPLPRRLVRHAHWPSGWYPLRTDAGPAPRFAPDVSAFPFVEVSGEGVYEIPVGPVHAGLIEPGHFRFSVVGETIIRMKARLWYLHRGVERLFEGRRPAEGLELAERISGDTAVGHALAFAMACEEALDVEVAAPDRLLRALLLELERLHNHVADLGAVFNDVAFGIAHAHTQRLRETLLRLNACVTGHRLLRGGLRIGGTQVLELPDPEVVAGVAAEAGEVVRLALDHPMVRDRLTGTAVLRRDDAARIGVLGYVARASGVDVDARRDHPFADLAPTLAVPVEDAGDVLARVSVRARELGTSAALVRDLVDRLAGSTGTPAGRADDGVDVPEGAARGVGLVEAWRGLLCHRVALDGAGRLARVTVVDPSFMTWPGLAVALEGTIVPDFPLANKSFNQSYAGNDL